MKDETKKRKANFDSDFGPDHPANRKAAEERGLVFDGENECYRDTDGCPILDRFGQPLG